MFGLVFSIMSRWVTGGGAPPPPHPGSDILLEDGTFLLLEDGVSTILLEV